MGGERPYSVPHEQLLMSAIWSTDSGCCDQTETKFPSNVDKITTFSPSAEKPINAFRPAPPIELSVRFLKKGRFSAAMQPSIRALIFARLSLKHLRGFTISRASRCNDRQDQAESCNQYSVHIRCMSEIGNVRNVVGSGTAGSGLSMPKAAVRSSLGPRLLRALTDPRRRRKKIRIFTATLFNRAPYIPGRICARRCATMRHDRGLHHGTALLRDRLRTGFRHGGRADDGDCAAPRCNGRGASGGSDNRGHKLGHSAPFAPTLCAYIPPKRSNGRSRLHADDGKRGDPGPAAAWTKRHCLGGRCHDTAWIDRARWANCVCGHAGACRSGSQLAEDLRLKAANCALSSQWTGIRFRGHPNPTCFCP